MNAPIFALALGIAVGVAGCQKQSDPSPPPDPSPETLPGEASSTTPPSRIQKALDGLEQTAPPSAAKDGPPPGGIYTVQQAESVLPVGAPMLVEVGTAGIEPVAKLVKRVPKAQQSDKRAASFSWAFQGAPVPAVDFVFRYQISPEDGSAKRGATRVNLRVSKPRMSGATGPVRERYAPLTEDLAKTEISWTQEPSGVHTPLSVRGPTQTDAKDTAEILARTLAATLVPFPSEAVGAGSVWMTTSRERYFGFDTITLRMFQLLTRPDAAKINVNVKTQRYAITDAVALPGAPEGSKLAQFSATGTATVTLDPGTLSLTQAEVASTLDAFVTIPARASALIPVQAEAQLNLHASK